MVKDVAVMPILIEKKEMGQVRTENNNEPKNETKHRERDSSQLAENGFAHVPALRLLTPRSWC